jgi:hypothetical protein
LSDDKQQPATPRTDALAAKSEYQGAYLHLCRQLERELALAKSAGLRGEQASYRIGYVDGATGKPPQVELTGPEKALCTPSHVLRSEPTEAMIDAAWAELQQWAAAAGEWQREQAACIMRAALGCAERQFDKVETPRTDALERQHKSGFGNTFYGEMAQHARQLERELACAKSAELSSGVWRWVDDAKNALLAIRRWRNGDGNEGFPHDARQQIESLLSGVPVRDDVELTQSHGGTGLSAHEASVIAAAVQLCLSRDGTTKTPRRIRTKGLAPATPWWKR